MIRLVMETGSMMAPNKMCGPISVPFSRTHTETLHTFSAASWRDGPEASLVG
jgi:hypothetical protein